jgi:hypothetical protein
MQIADIHGPLEVSPTTGIDILVDRVDPCAHADSVHRDRVFSALPT